ncbi:hypothetical protein [Candidatus Kuenenia stuttgartiensis]
MVVFKGRPALVGTLVDITINEATDLTLFGTI